VALKRLCSKSPESRPSLIV